MLQEKSFPSEGLRSTGKIGVILLLESFEVSKREVTFMEESLLIMFTQTIEHLYYFLKDLSIEI